MPNNTTDKKRGNICVKPGYLFNLKEGAYTINTITPIYIKNKDFLKLEIQADSYIKKTKKENVSEVKIRIAQKKEILKILDLDERKAKFKALKDFDQASDMFHNTICHCTLYISCKSIMYNYVDQVRRIFHISKLKDLYGEIEHIIGIKLASNSNISTHTNATYSKSGIYNRSIRQKNIYVFAYFDDLDEFLIIPGCLIDEDSFTLKEDNDIPY